MESVYKEFLPVGLNENNFYIFEKIAHTKNRLSVKNSNIEIYSVNGLNLVFI
jgi:hypothetical protein